jgi:Fic-DOC domain mobile mystery protein B
MSHLEQQSYRMTKAKDLSPSLSNRDELNTAESENILKARLWALRSRKLKQELLSLPSLGLLHSKMFNEVWLWAGKFRNTDKNIGMPWPMIGTQLLMLCQDTKYWLENDTYPRVEIAVRFHHKLVFIHPYVNGNGRHSRLATDLLLHYLREPALTWGGGENIAVSGSIRRDYIDSLKKADDGDIKPLLDFATRK